MGRGLLGSSWSGGLVPSGGRGLLGGGRTWLSTVMGGAVAATVVAGVLVAGGGVLAPGANGLGADGTPTAQAPASPSSEPTGHVTPKPSNHSGPLSLPDGYALQSKSGARVDSCAPVRYRLTGQLWTAEGEAAASAAITEVQALTALTFVRDEAASLPGTVDSPVVTIELVAERDDSELSGDTVGYAETHWVRGDAGAFITGGPIVIERELLDPSYGASRQERISGTSAVIVHELGHMLGLTHVTSKASIMNPMDGPGRPTKEDRQAFTFVGAGPCAN